MAHTRARVAFFDILKFPFKKPGIDFTIEVVAGIAKRGLTAKQLELQQQIARHQHAAAEKAKHEHGLLMDYARQPSYTNEISKQYHRAIRTQNMLRALVYMDNIFQTSTDRTTPKEVGR